jgi:imidazolonepropionase-like amidohydrolase
MTRLLVTILATFFCCLCNAQVTVVRAGRLIDPDSATVLTDQEILVVGNKVSAVGKQLHIPKDAKWIDLSDKTVLPGLIDCHTHLADGNVVLNGDTFDAIKKTASEIVLESVPNAQKTLLSGVTTVRDVGTYRALNDIALRDAIARGDIIGPRM